jgi:DNA helicase-2/ATP-dependent DNA helicase PcrA
MTLHAAKGLEFNTVVLAGLEDGLLPSSRSLTDMEKLEEERRLFYVGITRAEERLLLTRCRYRYTYGKMNDQLASRFVKEIPEQLLISQDSTHATPAQLSTWLSQWLRGEPATPALTGTGLTSPRPRKTGVMAGKPSQPTYAPPKVRTFKPSVTTTTPTNSPWKKNQPVKHAKFGLGVIKNVETRAQDTVLEISFKSGTKKIAAQFVEVV